MNYSQLTTNQQNTLLQFVKDQAAAIATIGQFLATLTGVDAEYNAPSGASAILSLLTSSEYSLTNLASANGTSANPIVTSATHNFTSDEVNNFVNITAGTNWTVSLRQIIAVSANAATLDGPVGTVAALTSGTANVLAAIPNQTGLAGAQPYVQRADLVTLESYIQVITALNDAAHRSIMVKVCGAANLK